MSISLEVAAQDAVVVASALLVVARLLQGVAAAVMMPASLALIGQAHHHPVRPRPIVAAAIAVHTDCSGEPLGSFSVVFKA